MAKIILFLGLIFVSQICFGKWTAPITLSTPKVQSISPSIFTDPITHVSHSIWVQYPEDEFHLVYAKVSADGKATAPVYLDKELVALDSDLWGEDGGQHLFVVYNGKKDKIGECAKGHPDKCYKMYFTESLDGGNTWSKPFMFKHENEEIDRLVPTIIYIKEKKQLYVVYQRGLNLAYTTRYGNGDFTPEAVMPFGDYTDDQTITFTVDKNTKKPKIHITYVKNVGFNQHVMYTSSLDEGKTWKTPKELASMTRRTDEEEDMVPDITSSSELTGDSLFLSFGLHHQVAWMWSEDDGNTWSNIIAFKSGDFESPVIKICPAPNNQRPRLHVIYSITTPGLKDQYGFGSFNLQTHLFKAEEHPFTGLETGSDYVMGCYLDKEKEILTAIVRPEGTPPNAVYFSSNDQLIGTTSYAD